jgi:hypothetical protein
LFAELPRAFDVLIEQTVALDREHLRKPFSIDNRPLDRSAWIALWRGILSAV